MTVLIEASEAYRNRSGIGRFSRALIHALIEQGYPLRFSPEDWNARVHDHKVRTLAKRIEHFGGHLWVTQGLSAATQQRTHARVVHSLSFFAPLLVRTTPITITLFDLAYFDLPDDTDPFWGRYARRMMPVFARHAAHIFTTSHWTREQIAARFAIPLDQITCIYGGVDPVFHVIEDSAALARVREKYNLPHRFFLYVGAWRRNKNLRVLFEACAGLSLVVTGEPFTPEETELPELARRMGVDAHFIGYAADEDLPAVYTLAQAVVLPSLYEGFGMPVLEAMACGAPVVISDIPVLRETAGDAALFFPPQQPDRLRDHLITLFDSPEQRLLYRERGLARASQFTWSRSAAAVTAVWDTL